MSIPLDRLYHYIEDIAEEIYGNPVIIYRFYPHGSKKLEDLMPLRNYSWQENNLFPAIYCNDQEPLDYNFYENYNMVVSSNKWLDLIDSLSVGRHKKNMKLEPTIYDQSLLLHSEQRSKELLKYKNNHWETVYYWNHALLALDWFRYAKHIKIKRIPTKKFLMYNRAWSGTREYRLKFADLLIDYKLFELCQTSVSFVDQNIHYKNHKFTNTDWQPSHKLENYFTCNNTSSTSSADFTIEDYANTDIEIVLETLFDDDRLHLTEKSLRPIACGQPFILAATHGSLEYLRRYGFKTFSGIIDESYDLIKDPVCRLHAIVQSMEQINNWSDVEQQRKMMQLQDIANYNRKHFFSNKFFNQIINELAENISTSLDNFKSTKSSKNWIQRWKKLMSYQDVRNFLESNQQSNWVTRNQFDTVYKEAKKLLTYT